MDTDELVQWIKTLYEHDNIKAFYNSDTIWRPVRAEVLKDQHNECQICKANGKYSTATTVHHIKFLRQHPELALDKKNLMAVCKDCHYNIHHRIETREQLNEERW